MKIVKELSLSKVMAQIVFLALPTILAISFLLWNANHYYTILQDQWFEQTVYVGGGIIIAIMLYALRIRFLPTFLIIVITLFSVYKVLDRYSVGEFDSFFIAVKFLIFSYLFTIGWLLGWMFQRVKFAPIIISGILVMLCLYVLSKTGEMPIRQWIFNLLPVLLYAVYIIYTHEQLKNVEKTGTRFWLNFLKRLIAFCLIASLFIGASILFLYKEIEEKIENFGGGGKEGEGMLKKEKDGTLSNQSKMGMGSQNKRSNELVFCAHINNNFPGTDFPNPLYLTNTYFTKYDSLTETFEIDKNIPFNDLFSPDLSKIPLFFTKSDSSVIKNSLSKRNRKYIELEIYKKKLSAKTFLAPSTAYFVQPITVEKDFQLEYYSAYRAKSYVSDLNSAYFIYNTDDPQIVSFQKQRFETLRQAKSYNNVDSSFMHYYTQFNNAKKYTQIQTLADSLSAGKHTTIDKVLAIRDYFLTRNEFGKRIFTYTDNPGVPGLPGASRLLNFLFESKKGYCAYYSGATLFLLRAMKIPSRIVTGFLTVDRSDKNKGWYFYYADQSHAWVQVYFPEYGWIDFDTTVGNEDSQQSPSPDGTPPMQPPKALLAASGVIDQLDTIKKTTAIHVNNLLFLDKEFEKINISTTLDLSRATIYKDSTAIPLQSVKPGLVLMAVSYKESLKNIGLEKTAEEVLNKIPKPISIDEIYLKENETTSNQETKTTIYDVKKPWWYTLLIALSIVLLLILLILAIPRFIYMYYKYNMKRAKTVSSKAYYMYKSSTFLLNQYGIKRGDDTPLQFAKNTIDKNYNTNFATFMTHYLSIKFANKEVYDNENAFLLHFFPLFEEKINKQTKEKFSKFLNLNNTINFYIQSDTIEKIQ